MITEILGTQPLAGGAYDGQARKVLAFTINIDFADDVPPEIRTNPRYSSQVEYTREAIRQLLLTDEYKQGKFRASLSHGTEGTDVEIGNPPTVARIEESNARLRYGSIKPERGIVSPKTYAEMREMVPVQYRSSELHFCGAVILSQDDVPDGSIRWFYGRIG